MYGNWGPLGNFINYIQRCCYVLSGPLSRFILRDLVLSSSNSPKVVNNRDNHQSAVMASANHIDISSSDDDFDEEDWDLEKIKSALDEDALSHRILPGSFTGHGGGNRASSSNGSSSRPNFDRHSQAQLQTRPSSSSSARITDSFPAIEDNSRSRGASGPDSGNHSSNQGSRRNLPSSLQQSVPGSRSSNLVREIHAKPYQTALQSQSYGTNPSHSGRGGDASRVLPPTMMHLKSVTNAMHVSSSDPMMHRTGVGEERVGAEHDERLVYQAALQDLNQPKVEASLPDGLLSVSLLRHQKIALAWMLQKETTSLHCLGGILADDQGLGKTISMIALIQMQKCLLSKSKPEGECSKKAEALNLDEDDDNGTVIIDKPKQDGESVDVKPEKSTSMQEFRTRRPAAGTLVVCPASVLRQWARELEEKVADEAKLDVLIYHGGNRTKDPVELAKYDVVLTTYAIVTNEVPKQPLVDGEDEDHKDGETSGLTSAFNSKKRKKETNGRKKGKKGRKGIDSSAFDSDSGTLARVGWCRVILDEAQTIKNHRTLVARACCGLRAKRRWCLSGTPIQNAIDELFSYFRFLRYDPYAAYKSFCNTIKIPISRNSLHGYKKLQAVLRAIMLRRTKGTFIDGEPIINLPPKTINLAKVDFSPQERAFYSKLEADSRSQFKAYAAAGTLRQNYANILLMLLRLRQACDHPLLVKGFSSDSVERLSSKMAKRLPRDMLIDLLSLLETNFPICGICKDPPEDAVVTTCRHVYCYQCISESLTGEGSTCPAPRCREQLAADVVYSEATLRDCLYDEVDGGQSSSSAVKPGVRQDEHSSSKIRAALDIIKAHCRAKSTSASELHNHSNGSSSSGRALLDEGPIKAIIFSQWTRMLDLIELSLNEALVQYRRLDGTMSLSARDKAVKEFNTDPEVTVMLMSLKAGNLGLNMVAASHVILMDLWWNPTTEDQAIDRAHRIGQTRPVTVSRITIKDTVEDRILALQEEKRKMVASAFGDDPSGGTATRLTVEDLRYLFML